MLAHFIVDFFIAGIGFGPNARGAQGRNRLMNKFIGVRHNGSYDHLTRCQPKWQATGMFFDQYPDEPFKRSQAGAMQHDRPMLIPIFADVAGVQAFRQNKIHLMGAALPIPANGVCQNKLQFWTIEGTFSRVHLRFNARFAGRGQKGGFCTIPNLIRAGALFWPITEFHPKGFKAEIFVNGS